VTDRATVQVRFWILELASNLFRPVWVANPEIGGSSTGS